MISYLVNYILRPDIILLVAAVVLISLFLAILPKANKKQPASQDFSQNNLDELLALNKKLEANARELAAKEFELSMANKRLENLDQAKSKFVAVTTHQLRTPLSAIKWTFEMMMQGQLGPVNDEQKEFLTKGFTSTERMISIVNSLLNVDTMEGEMEKYNFAAMDIQKMLDEILPEFSNQVNSKKISLKVNKTSMPLPSVMADAAKIRIVLENLIDNAIKYTPEGGEVTVSLSDAKLNTAENSILISVKDSGIGITEEDKPKIFNKFYRAPNAVKMEPDGSGIGLYICRDIIERHNGTIWFENNGGTTFSFTLPLKQKAA